MFNFVFPLILQSPWEHRFQDLSPPCLHSRAEHLLFNSLDTEFCRILKKGNVRERGYIRQELFFFLHFSHPGFHCFFLSLTLHSQSISLLGNIYFLILSIPISTIIILVQVVPSHELWQWLPQSSFSNHSCHLEIQTQHDR